MAYARSSTRRSYRRSSRYARRKIPHTRRRYVKRTSRTPYRRKMTQKKILNLTSIKKRDTMLSLTNVIADRSRPTSYTSNDAVLSGGAQPYIIPWVATARTTTVNGTKQGTIATSATRSSTTCYIRGLREDIEINVFTGCPWQWRRIVFFSKGLTNAVGTPGSNFYYFNVTAEDYRRTVNEIYGAYANGLNAFLFKGTEGSDWNDLMIAPVDTTRVSVLYDKTRTIASGNEEGVIRKYKMWHGVNKNLTYDDDEFGGDETTSNLSTLSKVGCGDMMVVDIFKPRGGSAGEDRMAFKPNATLYWHEK
ncbi:capsid protein [pteropus associated gemycircularvirus 1]|uniref:Capsid protein n=1 Tax=pteropus associated gemycircularvirus 1 TaxID=1985395 RepID=A0A140CTP4_9VIRU|nr:capsid protein [Pacific flying fox faeces associated gemycircularvirus-10]AMH87701.1 capsid protein [Pacific flying fox faeces associated gemycircularvirus-10]